LIGHNGYTKVETLFWSGEPPMLETLMLFGIALTAIRFFEAAVHWVFSKLKEALPEGAFITVIAAFALMGAIEYTRAAVLVRLVIDPDGYSPNAPLILGSLAIASTIVFYWANEIRLMVNGGDRRELILSRYGCALRLCLFFVLLVYPHLTTSLLISTFMDVIHWLHAHPWAGTVLAFPGVALEISFAVGVSIQLRQQCTANKA
jgi:hypothetical protein